jgi:2-hydroxy-3-keto-5-methylthiopentenyl-1-phosphate phosphatase
MKTPILFLDFDGTISEKDAIDAILERFADEKWKVVEEMWKANSIGSRECLLEQVALIDASPEKINNLLDEISLDEGFPNLLDTCRQFSVQTHIVSDGFDYCIERILARAKTTAKKSSVFSSHLEYANNEWRTDFPYFPTVCPHGCATCKPEVMKILNPNHAPTVFVGDGLSDRYAAQSADVVFAKKSLAAYCRENEIEHFAYQTLADVAEMLEELLHPIASGAQFKKEFVLA